MAKRSVIWTPRAEAELKEVLQFYRDRNESTTYSVRLLDDVEKLTGLVSRFPYLGRITTNGVTRVVVKGKYLLFYEVYSNAIAVMSFWDNRRDPKDRMV
jgi:plasmid stabilization system protein ParE